MRQLITYGIKLFLIFIILFTYSCSTDREEKDSSATKGDIALRLAFPNKIQYAPFIIGISRGIFQRHGLKVTHVAGVGGIDAAEAVLSGQADLGAMGDAPASILLSRCDRCRILCGFMQSRDMHRLVAAQASGIKETGDLKGKRITVQMGSSTHGALLSYLEEHSVPVQSVTLVPLSPLNFPEATLKGDVDAIAGSEPWPTNVMKKCPGSFLVDYLRVKENNFPHVLISGSSAKKDDPETVRRVLDAVKEDISIIEEDRAEAAGIVAAKTGKSPKDEEKALNGLEWGIYRDASVVEGLGETASFLHDQGLIRTMPDIKKAVMWYSQQ